MAETATETLEATSPEELTVTDGEREMFDQLTAAAEETDDQPAETVAESTDETPASEAATETVESTDGEPAAEPEGLDEALAALKRDGIPEERINEWFQEDGEGMVEHGLGRAKAQRDQDAYGFEFRENREAFERWQADRAGQDGDQATTTTDDSPTGIEAIIDTALEPLQSEENRDLLGDAGDAVKSAIVQTLSHVQEQMSKEVTAQVDQLSQQIAEMKATGVDQKLDAARDRLTERYPKLKDDAVFQSVLNDHYDTLIASPRAEAKYNNDPSMAFADACKLAFGDASVDELKKTLLSRSQQRRNGQPRAQTAGSTANSEMGEEEQEQQAFFKLREQHYGKAT